MMNCLLLFCLKLEQFPVIVFVVVFSALPRATGWHDYDGFDKFHH